MFVRFLAALALAFCAASSHAAVQYQFVTDRCELADASNACQWTNIAAGHLDAILVSIDGSTATMEFSWWSFPPPGFSTRDSQGVAAFSAPSFEIQDAASVCEGAYYACSVHFALNSIPNGGLAGGFSIITYSRSIEMVGGSDGVWSGIYGEDSSLRIEIVGRWVEVPAPGVLALLMFGLLLLRRPPRQFLTHPPGFWTPLRQ